MKQLQTLFNAEIILILSLTNVIFLFRSSAHSSTEILQNGLICLPTSHSYSHSQSRFFITCCKAGQQAFLSSVVYRGEDNEILKLASKLTIHQTNLTYQIKLSIYWGSDIMTWFEKKKHQNYIWLTRKSCLLPRVGCWRQNVFFFNFLVFPIFSEIIFLY